MSHCNGWHDSEIVQITVGLCCLLPNSPSLSPQAQFGGCCGYIQRGREEIWRLAQERSNHEL